MQKEKFVQNIFFSFIKTGCKSALSWEGSSIYKKGVGQLTKGVENSNVLVASFLTVVTAITISVSGVTVVSTAIVSVPCVSSGISASFGLRLCHDSGNNESYEKLKINNEQYLLFNHFGPVY